MKSLQDTHIKEFEIEGNAIYRNNTQAYVVTKIKYLDNKTQEYKTIFNYEQGSWKLLGTVLAD